MNADLDNPEVEYAAMPNNTEHREMIDFDVQLHEENEVEFVEDNDGGRRRNFQSFLSVVTNSRWWKEG